MRYLIEKIILTVLMFTLAGCVSTSVVQTMMDDITALKASNTELENKVTSLESELQTLKERTEQMESLKPDDSVADSKDEEEPPQKPDILPTPVMGDAEMMYSKAQSLYHSGKLREAGMSFEQAAVLSNASEFKARCYYWMGECFYAQRSFHRALDLFGRVVNEYPNNSKSSDALLKIGFTYCEMGEYNKASQFLEEFLNKYPDHRAVSLAREKLDTLKNLH